MNRTRLHVAVLVIFVFGGSAQAHDLPHGVVLHNGTLDSDPTRALPAVPPPLTSDYSQFWEGITPTNVGVKLTEVVNFSQAVLPPFLPPAPKSPRSGTEWTVDWQTSVLDKLHRLKYEYRTVGPEVDGELQQEPFVGNGLVVSHIIQNNSGVAWAGFTFRLTAADIMVNCSLGDSPCESPEANVGSILAESLDREIRLVEDIGYSSADMSAQDVELQIQEGPDAGPEITLLFNQGFFLEDGQEFELRYTVNHQGFPFGPNDDTSNLPDGFFLYQHPIPVPAPSAVALAMIGFGMIGWFKRRVD
ncbi:MAG: hypothetical protein V3W34_18630 [Phycisphaerae bacterium]